MKVLIRLVIGVLLLNHQLNNKLMEIVVVVLITTF